jgi:hypothetical protein
MSTRIVSATVAVTVAVVAVVLVGFGGTASAHTKARIVAANPASAPAGTAVAVTGASVGAPEGQVQIRWDSVTGPVLGTADVNADGNFAASVAVPETTPGVHSLVVVADGTGVARTSFEVSPGAPAARPAALDVPTPLAREAAAPAPADPSSALTVGASLLAVGLVALFSGVTLAGLRRRRVPAVHTSPTHSQRKNA